MIFGRITPCSRGSASFLGPGSACRPSRPATTQSQRSLLGMAQWLDEPPDNDHRARAEEQQQEEQAHGEILPGEIESRPAGWCHYIVSLSMNRPARIGLLFT